MNDELTGIDRLLAEARMMTYGPRTEGPKTIAETSAFHPDVEKMLAHVWIEFDEEIDTEDWWQTSELRDDSWLREEDMPNQLEQDFNIISCRTSKVTEQLEG